MKLWRKIAKKTEDESGQIVRNGRSLRDQMHMMEQFGKSQKKSYPLLDALLNKAQVTYVLTAKQQNALKTMIESENKEEVNEAI
jgi:hypothetical protein